MGDETDSTDNDLRHRLAALEDEVQSLRNDDGAKSTRRMMLKGGVAALGLGALATPSSAGTNQAGAIGGEGATLDLWTEDLYIVEQGSTPSAPPSGYIDIYAKTDGNFYKLQSDGTESLLGGDGLSPGEDFDGQGTSDFTNLSSVSTDKVSNTDYFADPGEVQATIDAARADGGGIVHLVPGSTYNAGTEIHLKENVRLACNGARIEVSADHNGVFLDNNSSVTGLRLFVTDAAFASDALVLDTSRTVNGRYENDDGVHIEGRVRNNAAQAGVGLALRDPAGTGIGRTVTSDIEVNNFDSGILGRPTNGGYVNTGGLKGTVSTCRANLHHTGTGPCKSTFWGTTQAGGGTDYQVLNETGNGSWSIIGRLWDNGGIGVSTISGPEVSVVTWEATDIENNMASGDRAAGQLVWDFKPNEGWDPVVQWFDLESGDKFSLGTSDGVGRLWSDGAQILGFDVRNNNAWVGPEGGGMGVRHDDLTTVSGTADPAGDNNPEIAVHTGDNELYRWDPAGASWEGLTVANSITP